MGLIRTYEFGTVSLGIGCTLFAVPSASYWIFGVTVPSTIITWVTYIPVCLVSAIGFMTCLPVVNTMQSNAADPERYPIDSLLTRL